MREQELWKKGPIYFYYLSISKHKDAKDDSAYSMDQIIIAFSQLLEYIMKKGLPERKKDITSSEKVVWLDSYEDLKNGNYDVIFKSAKYNHVRNEIDTETMQERGRRKRPQDGDDTSMHSPCKRRKQVSCSSRKQSLWHNSKVYYRLLE